MSEVHPFSFYTPRAAQLFLLRNYLNCPQSSVVVIYSSSILVTFKEVSRKELTITHTHTHTSTHAHTHAHMHFLSRALTFKWLFKNFSSLCWKLTLIFRGATFRLQGQKGNCLITACVCTTELTSLDMKGCAKWNQQFSMWVK